MPASSRGDSQRGLFDPAPASAPAPVKRGEDPEVLTVGQVTRRISDELAAFGRIAVEGEVSSLKRAGSGHLYFGLKDQDAFLDCKIWRSRAASALRFELAEGMRVVCRGALDVYKPRGSYSLIVDRVEQRGIGELLARLEELKQDLAQRGWFDRKRPLPELPACIGLVTSRDTAAFQDFLRTRSLRWPLYPVRFVHTLVQGAGAAQEIAASIRRLDASGVSVIVVIRGGGSLEDLWCFNELAVAEAIHACSVPVVSGVGHETDVTLTDLVADHRAHTPTDAAQTVIPERRAYVDRLERAFGYLSSAMERAIQARTDRLDRLERTRTLQQAGWLLDERLRALEGLRKRLVLAGARGPERLERPLARAATGLGRQSPALRLGRLETQLAALAPRLHSSFAGALDGRAKRLDLAHRALSATSPFAVLRRGYSITRRAADKTPVRRAADLAPGDAIETLLDAGSLISEVTETRESREGEEGR